METQLNVLEEFDEFKADIRAEIDKFYSKKEETQRRGRFSYIQEMGSQFAEEVREEFGQEAAEDAQEAVNGELGRELLERDTDNHTIGFTENDVYDIDEFAEEYGIGGNEY